MELLSHERWQQVNALLDEALDLDPDARRAFLSRIEDGALRTAVARLLTAEAEAPPFLSAPAADYAAPMLTDLPDADPIAPDRRLGAYRLLSEIGRGGMGRVFLAERADGQYEQQVALKLLRPGLDADDAQRRFRTERQILASLSHPHIARLLDGGMTDDGRPYLAMEYVQGRPLTAYCDEQRLPIRERLRLFIRVTDAVHHAHRNLVVHRDLKPSNIVVTAEGEVKLLDFGIAKLLGEGAAGGPAPMTRTGRRWMTPEYAAPEQVLGEAITTATDVYQLGAVLYELLTGHRPFELDGGVHAVEHAVLEAEPEKPSTAVSRVTERPAEGDAPPVDATHVGQARRTQPERLRRALRGDLDTIVLKTLRKDPEARYASAEALGEDIKRHLAGLPVQARTPTVRYRVRRFVRRHRAGVAASTLVVLSLVGGLGAALWQARAARAERDQAETLAIFLEDLLAAPDPLGAERLDTLSVRDLVTRSQAQVETALQGQPVLQARMLHVIGQMHSRMQHYDEAESVLERALALRREHLGPRTEAAAETMVALAVVRGERDGYGAMAPSLRDALAIQREHLRPHDPALARTLALMGMAVGDAGGVGSLQDAERWVREALAIQQAAFEGPHAQTASILNQLAELRSSSGDLEGALALRRQALYMLRVLYGEDHPRVAGVLYFIAFDLVRAGRPVEAERYARENLAIRRAAFGPRSIDVRHGLTVLASALRAQGRYDEAEAALREALTTDARRPSDHAVVMGALATLLREKGELAGAAQAQAQTVTLVREGLGPTHPMLAFSLTKLANIHREQAHYAEAERVLLGGLGAWPEESGPGRQLRRALVALYEAWGRPARAAAYRAGLAGDTASMQGAHRTP